MIFQLFWKMGKKFLAGVAKNGRDRLHNDDQGVAEHGLSRPARQTVEAVGVKTIFDRFEVKCREIGRAEAEEGGDGLLEIEVLVGVGDFLGEKMQLSEKVFIDVLKRSILHGSGQIVDIAEQVARSVPYLLLEVGDGRYLVVRDQSVARVVHGPDPQTKHVRSVGWKLLAALLAWLTVDNDRWIDDIAFGFAHFASVAVQNEAVGDDALVRRVVCRSHRRQQRGLEPSAVLIRSFEVDI